MIYFVESDREKKNDAGAKAPRDIADICREMGMTPLYMPIIISNRGNIRQKLWLLWTCTTFWMKLGRQLQEGDVVLYQHPCYGNRITKYFIEKLSKRKGCRFVAIIHDLQSLRRDIEGGTPTNAKTNEIADNMLLKCFDVIISHNKHMSRYLCEKWFDKNKIINLGIFDYLTDCTKHVVDRGSSPSIAIAGNLLHGKCAYIYEIYGRENTENVNLHINLYGSNFDSSRASGGMIYHGSFEPEELPAVLEGDFGLVWDGTSAETCAGNTGEYLRYNNPHKTSLYLASGMPVIVWSQAAIADFVLENGVGIAVDSLYGLDEVIANVSDADYKIMCENVKKIGKRIREGCYFRDAMEMSLKTLGN